MSNYELTATPTLTNNVVNWQLCVVKPVDQAHCGTAPNYPGVDVPKGNANQSFNFTIINDKTGLNIQFAPSPPPPTNPGPVWVQAGSKPNGPVLDAQIKDGKRGGSNNTELTFTDKNDNSGTLVLKYQLNFVGQNGTAVAPIDPDITNGGKSLANSTSAVLWIAVAVLLAIAILLYVRMRAKNP